MGGVPRDVIDIVRMGTREDARRADLHLRGYDERLGARKCRAIRGTNTLFGLPNSDNLVNTHCCQFFPITAPGDVRHRVRGRYLDVPWTKRREVGCLEKQMIRSGE